MKIATKAEFFRLWRAGALGNTLGTWTARDVVDGRMPDGPPVGIRYADPRGGGGRCDYDVPRTCVPARLLQWQRDGLDPNLAIVCESAPDDRQTLQGEVCRGLFGWEGMLGRAPGLRMRDAIAAGYLRPLHGAAVRHLLWERMDPSSLDDLDALLDLYPDATVEFTCYDVMVGTLPGRNTIFWEVRNY